MLGVGECGLRPALTGACGARPGAAQPPRAGAGSAPRTPQTWIPAVSSEGREERIGRKAISFFATPDIPASSAPCAQEAAYSAAGFEVWTTGRLGPGRQGCQRGGRQRREPAQQPRALCPDPWGSVAASHPPAWEYQAVRGAQGPAWGSPKAASYLTGPLPSALREHRDPNSRRAPHSPPGGAGIRRARPPPRRNELSTAALGTARGHARIRRQAGNQGGNQPWGRNRGT